VSVKRSVRAKRRKARRTGIVQAETSNESDEVSVETRERNEGEDRGEPSVLSNSDESRLVVTVRVNKRGELGPDASKKEKDDERGRVDGGP